MIIKLLEGLPQQTVLKIVVIKKNDPKAVPAPGVNDSDGLGIVKEEWDTLYKLSQDSSYRHVLTLCSRPGSSYFARYLELTYFHPDKPELNNLFDQRFFRWNDLHFTILTVPASFDHVLHETATVVGVRLVDRALPVLIGGGKIERLPLHDSYLYTMENAPGHMVYTQGWEKAHEQENKDVQTIENKKLTPHHTVQGGDTK